MARWTAKDIPALSGRLAIVTGANSGLGFHTALELARHGAYVTMACRDQGRGDQALSRLRTLLPDAVVDLALLDLADLSSVQRFAAEYQATHEGLDLLMNNAGLMAIPYRKTADGFEMQLGTNHLGHFALTGRLLPLLAARPAARVVTVSSLMHRAGQIHFEDLQSERKYGPGTAYGQAKLANVLFAFELQRRIDAAGMTILSVVVHPGYAATNLSVVGTQMTGNKAMAAAYRLGDLLLAQSDVQGALPSLYAATAPDVRGGAFYGPNGWGGMRGFPIEVKAAASAYDEQVAKRLWQVSEELTDVNYSILATR